MSGCLLLMGLALGAPLPADPPEQLKQLQGVWRVVRSERNGSASESRKDDPWFFVITDDLLQDFNQYSEGTPAYRIKVVGNTFNKIPLSGTSKGIDHPGIYSLEKDTLKVCVLRT